MNDEPHPMTPFDQYVSTSSMQMIKLAIPFLPPNNQRALAVYVKFMELRHTLFFFENMKQHAHSIDSILETVRPYMSADESDSLDQMMGMMSMMQMMQEMQQEPDGVWPPFQGENTENKEEGDTDESLDG